MVRAVAIVSAWRAALRRWRPRRLEQAALPPIAFVAAALLAAAGTQATPIVPRDDHQVIERLPPATRLSDSTDPVVAVREARALLDASRRDGEPRQAGRALARLARWRDAASAPAEVVMALADTEQYLHQFASATRRLHALVARDAAQPQAWLLLATLHRLAGRYAESDAACAQLAQLAVQPYAAACTAENQALRGAHAAARAELLRLVARHPQPATQAWLYTTLAETAERGGDAAAAEAAWRQALALAPDTYARIGLADFLLDRQRPADAWDVLASEARSDGVLLRQAIAARRAQRPEAAALQRELRERFVQADLRPESGGHERERALAALDLEDKPAQALSLARRNVATQREPIDLWLLLRCAQAAGDARAADEARQLARTIGLHDARLDTL